MTPLAAGWVPARPVTRWPLAVIAVEGEDLGRWPLAVEPDEVYRIPPGSRGVIAAHLLLGGLGRRRVLVVGRAAASLVFRGDPPPAYLWEVERSRLPAEVEISWVPTDDLCGGLEVAQVFLGGSGVIREPQQGVIS